ncbi:Transcription initiation factor TFIID subunit 4b-like protein [Drosera capensis]
MHSGVEKEASSNSLSGRIASALLFEGSDQATSQQYSRLPPPSGNENASSQSQHVPQNIEQQGWQQSSEPDLGQHVSGEKSRQPEFNACQISGDLAAQRKQTHELKELKIKEDASGSCQPSHKEVGDSHLHELDKMQSSSQLAKLQRDKSQQANAQVQANAEDKRSLRYPYIHLMSIVFPVVNIDKAMQLQDLYKKLATNEIDIVIFKRGLEDLIGGQMLKWAALKLEQQEKPQHIGQTPASDTSSGRSLTIQVQKDSSHAASGVNTPAKMAKQPDDIQMRHLQPRVQRMNTVSVLELEKKKMAGQIFKKAPADPTNGSDVKTFLVDLFTEAQARVGLIDHPLRAPASSLGNGIPVTSNVELSEIPSFNGMVGAVIGSKFPSRKPFVGQKKPFETHGSSSSLSSKKQKVLEPSLDQSANHSSDVTTLIDMDLLAELEELFPIVKSGSQISEVPSRAVQKEDERLILEKAVEERLRTLIRNLVRVSKQRVDSEKSGHRTVVTSDIQQQISSINHEAKEEQKKLAEAQKLLKLYEANKEKNNQIRTSAAKVSAHATVGNNDILSKWQLMAEEAKRRGKGGAANTSRSQAIMDSAHGHLADRRNNQRAGRQDNLTDVAASGSVARSGMTQVSKAARNISVQDLITVLEREPQMTKSIALYRLYERIHSDPSGD